MVVAIHQPEFSPWLGFFHKMAKCDKYIILDNVQFKKNNFQNRNQLIDTNGNTFWISVPVKMKGYLQKQIKDMEIDQTKPWARKVWNRIVQSYNKHPYFNNISQDLESIFSVDYTYLIDVNLALIYLIRRHLNINVSIVRSSSLEITGKRSELLLQLCKSQNALTYLSGPSGRSYLDEVLFQKEKINVEYQEFQHPCYPAPKFRPFLSTLDLIFNHGPNSREILGIS